MRSDKALVMQILTGQRDLFAVLIDRYQDRLRSVLSYYCLPESDVEEFLQEGFSRAYQQLGSFDTSRELFPWLAAVTLNALRSEARRRGAERRNARAYLQSLQMSRAGNDLDGAFAEGRTAALKTCMEKLSAAHTDIIHKRYFLSLKIRQIAAKLKAREATVRERLSYVRKILRDCIERQLRAEDARGDI